MKRMYYCLVGLAFVLMACATLIPSPTPNLPPADTNPPTDTSSATDTALPTDTSIPTDTAVPVETLTPSLPPEQLKTRFAIIGDYGMDNSAEADVAALIQGWQPDLIITTGDNNYPSGAADTIDANIGKYFSSYIFPYIGAFGPGADLNRFFPSLGNHDWYTSEARPYLDYFILPGNERYYDFTWGAVHFFALDSDENEPDGINAGSAQAAWLEQGLATSSSPWNVVYMHYPPYSSGSHGSTDWMQWPFAAGGADAVLAGHDHLYERLLVDGIPFFTNGAGGGGLYDFGDPLSQSQFRYNANYGASLVTVSEMEIFFEFYSRVGDLIDSYRVTKPG